MPSTEPVGSDPAGLVLGERKAGKVAAGCGLLGHARASCRESMRTA
ncbi:hypothetical protein ACIA74_44905 [Streptomyces sp. NPDC051658]